MAPWWPSGAGCDHASENAVGDGICLPPRSDVWDDCSSYSGSEALRIGGKVGRHRGPDKNRVGEVGGAKLVERKRDGRSLSHRISHHGETISLQQKKLQESEMIRIGHFPDLQGGQAPHKHQSEQWGN